MTNRSQKLNSKIATILIGVGGTLAIDCFTFSLRMFGIKTHGIQYIGRWLATLPDGVIFHKTIMQSASQPAENILGWIAHYLIGISFAFLFVKLFGQDWLMKPSIIGSLVIPLLTLMVPIFVIQPLFGFGVGFSNLPNQNILLLRIFLIHLFYGFGTYFSGLLISRIFTNSTKILWSK
jgi:hypothetical protein